jgi:hypothetical protein
MPSTPTVLLPDPATVWSLRRYLSLAARVDPGGAARLVGRGELLACYVAPLHGSGGPTVLGLRVQRLGAPCDLDVTAPLAALLDRLPVTAPEPGPGTALAVDLGLPPAPASSAGWAGVSPPRAGWEPLGRVDVAELRAVVAAGVDEIVVGTPPTAGAAQVSALRARVWGRPLARRPQIPGGIAFVAEALAFLDEAEPATLHRRGPWSRLSTPRGHTLARTPMLAATPTRRG